MELLEYRAEDWQLFIGSSTRSLKYVLLHNGNCYASLTIACSTKLKEQYENIKVVLQKLCYHEHQWFICVYQKMMNSCLGSKVDTQGTLVSSACGIVEQSKSIGK